MSEQKALVANIQRSSVNDGPGMRTTVFFKGCPLNCVWCHNPECINSEAETLFYPENCIHCGMCENGCYSGARVLCGKKMSAEEITAEIALDKDYYGKDGGATFSGGEPMQQKAVLLQIIKNCKHLGIKTAIETSLYIFDKDVFQSIDTIMADFKIFDNEKHVKYTGVSNDRIKGNFRFLDSIEKPFLVRTPIVPGINDNTTEIKSIRDFLKTLKNCIGYELLPYNPLGIPKQRALGMSEIRFDIPSKQKMEVLQKYADLYRTD